VQRDLRAAEAFVQAHLARRGDAGA
jgi:hypothetical protein